MFDFIKKRLNKTIKDASDIEEGEEIEQINEENIPDTIDETPKKEEKKKGLFGFLNRNKDEDKKQESQPEPDNESKEEEEKVLQEKKEDTTTSEDIINKDVDNKNIIEDEKTIEKPEEDEEPKEKKSRFNFFKRNKNKDEKKDEKKEIEPEIDEIEEENTEEKAKEKEVKYEGEETGGRFGFITAKTIKEDDIEEILESLEMSLIEGDVAFEVADTIVESIKEDLIGRKIKRRGDMELFTTNALKKSIYEIIDNGEYDLLGDIKKVRENGEPYKIMFVGINGTGKTTTIAKVATYLQKHGYTSVLGASDTFRAGAIEQLEYHANNLNMKIIKHPKDSDPAAVAYDAVDHAKATGKDVVLIDTSGRMQTNTNLMDEMKKIKRISKPDIVIYVGDALMGNDATEQAYKFNEVIDIDGIILTKTDADAKGGAALSIGHVIHKPIIFIGVGQGYDDLLEFKPEWMINQIFDTPQEAEA